MPSGSRVALGPIQYARLIGAPLTTGDYWFVSARDGSSNGNSGEHPDAALATVAKALDDKVAAGDVVVVDQGYTETAGGAGFWDIDTSGVQVWGVPGWIDPRTGFPGPDNRLPAITFDTTTDDIDFDAAGVGIHNLRLINAVDSLAAPCDVNAADCLITGCIFDAPTTGKQTLTWVDVATAGDGFRLYTCRTKGLANTEAGPVSVITMVGVDDFVIAGCFFYGDYSVACIEGKTTACLRGLIERCTLGNLNTTGDAIINMVASSTGIIREVSGYGGNAAIATGIIVNANMQMVDCRGANSVTHQAATLGTVST